MTKRRAFSYIRMSTETQLQGHSLERQLTLTRDYAKEKGFDLVEDLQDIGLSAHDGTNIKKGKLGKFLQAAKDGKIEKDSVLLVESLDRLSRRTPMQAFIQFSEIISHGIEIHTIFDRQIYTEESINQNPGQLFSSIGYMLRAYSESEEKSKRLKKKWQSKRSNLQNGIMTAICPAWLSPRKDRSGFDVRHDRAKTVKKIFDLCIQENMGAYSITRYLNQHIDKYMRFTAGRKRSKTSNAAHSGGWQKSYVTKILNNPAVFGEFHPHEMVEGKRTPTKKIVQNYFPTIISERDYLLAQSKLRSRRSGGGGRKGETFSNLFTKLAFCGNCDASVHFINKAGSSKGGSFLRCYNSHSKHKCTCGQWRYHEFEESFFSFCQETDFSEVFKRKDEKSEMSHLLDERSSQAERARRLQQQLLNTLDLTSKLSVEVRKSVQKRIEEISKDLSAAENFTREAELAIEELSSRTPTSSQKEILGYIKTRREKGIQDNDVDIRRRIHKHISSVIEKIEIFNSRSDFKSWEVDESLSVHVRNHLAKMGYKTEIELTRLFDGDKGRKLFDEMERFYIVHFKNGQQKIVHPFIKQSKTYSEAGQAKLIRSIKSSTFKN